MPYTLFVLDNGPPNGCRAQKTYDLLRCCEFYMHEIVKPGSPSEDSNPLHSFNVIQFARSIEMGSPHS